MTLPKSTPNARRCRLNPRWRAVHGRVTSRHCVAHWRLSSEHTSQALARRKSNAAFGADVAVPHDACRNEGVRGDDRCWSVRLSAGSGLDAAAGCNAPRHNDVFRTTRGAPRPTIVLAVRPGNPASVACSLALRAVIQTKGARRILCPLTACRANSPECAIIRHHPQRREASAARAV